MAASAVSDQDALQLLTDLIATAKRGGADGADAVMFKSASLSLSRRLGKPEGIERSESDDLGLRVLVGKRQAVVSSTDLAKDALAEIAERAVAMAKAAPEDAYCGLAEPELLAGDPPDLDICDEREPDPDELGERAAEAEDAARAVKGVTNSEGAEAGWGSSRICLAASNGFAETYASSRHSLAVAVIAGEGTNMERDYEFSSTVYADDLKGAEVIGREAGERAVARLGGRKVETAAVPVIYEPRVSSSLLRHLSAAINGISVARGTSFLKDKMAKAVFADAITIVDDPHRARGLGSKPFDGEGLANERRKVIDAGVLSTWLLDLGSARQLGLSSTGHAARGTSAPPSPAATNLYLEAGTLSPAELMSDIGAGLYVTELIGMGVNILTGDYSRGAAGFWIENGEIAYPVSEVTIAGNLNDMFAQLTAADDLEFRYAINAPTVRIDGMTVAGK
ncbi:MAG: TldD/PmbA family protein [Proteobacteria bacterium]|nr:TldD/PmbA family protein [Pseudomonadota bacterium]